MGTVVFWFLQNRKKPFVAAGPQCRYLSLLANFCCLDVFFVSSVVVYAEVPALLQAIASAMAPGSGFVINTTVQIGLGVWLAIPGSLFRWLAHLSLHLNLPKHVSEPPVEIEIGKA